MAGHRAGRHQLYGADLQRNGEGYSEVKWLLHFALLIAFSLFAFSYNPGRLFLGNDGPMLLSLASEQIRFFSPTLDLHQNFQQGIGNLSFPVNLSIMPGYWMPFMIEGRFTPIYIYTWWACLLFATTLLVGWNYRFERRITFGAAWLVTILSFPYLGDHLAVYQVTASSPFFIWYPFCIAVADIGVRRMGGTWRATILYSLLVLLGIFLMIIASPVAVVLMAPLLGISFLVHFLKSQRHARLRRVTGCVLVLAACVALGWVEYVLGLVLYSSSGHFLKELLDFYEPHREFASILFQGHIKDRAFGPFLFLLATLGAVRAIRKDTLVLPAYITLGGQMLHAGIAAQVLALSGGWSGPPPIYTELTFFPLYALFATHLIVGITNRRIPAMAWYGAIVLMVSYILITPRLDDRNMVQSYAMPPVASPIIEALMPISVHDGKPFRGRVATIWPGKIKEQIRYANQFNIAVLNDHQTSGLWLYDIPTLHEYNQIMTPAFYRIVRDFLTTPNDKQNRSWTNLSYADTRILGMLGVSHLISFDAAVDGAEKITQFQVSDLRPLYLHKLDKANTQGVSVDRLHYVPDLRSAIELMAMKDFGLNDAVIIEKGDGQKPGLVHTVESSIQLENGSYRIRAKSEGTGMLLVPIEFSRCMDITPIKGGAYAVRLNIALTGLVFEREMDILLSTRIGPFHHPRCRLDDHKEFKAMMKGG